MPKCIRAVGIGLLVAAAAVVLAADPPAPTPAELAKQLGDRDYRTREDATKKIWELGEAARPALEAVLKDGTPEAISRARKVLDKFNRGILPDTPKELLALIDKFITATEEEGSRFDTARQLIARGPTGTAALARLLRKGFGSANERTYFFSQLQQHLRRTVPVLLFDGKDAEAEAQLRLNSYGPRLSAQLDYAVFMARRDKAKELIEQAAEARTLPGDVAAAGDLALLCAYRVAGESAKLKTLLAALTKGAKPAAPDPDEPRGGRPNLLGLREELLLDAGDWATLAAEPPAASNTADGLKAFRLRAAGKIKEADALLAEVKDSDVADVGGYAIETGALALLLNGKTEDGIARLKTSESAPHVLTDMQAVRLEFKEAMDVIAAGLAAKPPKPGDEDEFRGGYRLTDLYLAKKGRILGQLGRRDSAVQVFTKMAETLNPSDGVALMQLIKAEVRTGFPDLAAELLGRAQEAYDTGNTGNPFRYTSSQDPYEILFEGDAEAAAYWWKVLRQSRPKDDGAKRMLTVRKLLAGKLPTDDVKKLLDEAAKAKPAPQQGGRGGRRFRGEDNDGLGVITPFDKAMGTATVQRILGDTAAATATLTEYANTLTKPKKAGPATEEPPAAWPDFDGPNDRGPGNRQWVFGVDESFRLWQDLSELLIADKKPKDAAAVLLDGWKLHPENGLLLYYSGRALVLAGDEKEGKRRIGLSHLVSLANVRVRGRFLEELANRAESADDLRNERDAARLCAWLPYPECNGNVWNQIARAAILLRDYPAAVDANRRAIHYVLRTAGVTYVEGYAYVNVVATLRGVEARQLLADGKPGEAVAAARESLALLPTNTDLVIALVTGLDKAGRKADADALYRQTMDALGRVLKDHPDSGWARHLSGWVASGCRRDLPAALASAKKAAELEPESKAHRSGLAEAHFRNGEREQAVAVMAKLTAEDRRNHFYRRQLDRYKTAGFDAPLPDADDD